MNNIVLTSNGFLNTSKRSSTIDLLFKQLARNKKVLIITNATKSGSNQKGIIEVKENFESIGAKQVEVLEFTKENIQIIFQYDVIYVLGGDPRILLDDMWDCNFKNYLIEFLQRGVYIGESAGSMVLCDNLEWVWNIKKGSKPKYDILPKKFEGLNLVEEKIFPHYNQVSQEMKNKIKQYEEEENCKITRLEDGEFILKTL